MLQIKETPTRLIITDKRDLLFEISQYFRYQAPNYWRSPKYQVFLESGGQRGWDGYIYPAKWVDDNRRIELGRGHKDSLLEWIDDNNVDFDGSGLLESPFACLTIDDIPDGILPGFINELDESQRFSIVELLKNGFGCIRASVSSGKTALLFAAVAMIRRQLPDARCLYLVPTERLVKQATENGRGFLPDWDITQYGGGKKDPTGKQVVVATVATIHANFNELVSSGWLKSFTTLLVDECAHAGSGETWQRIIKSVPAFFRFGASDTLKNERKEDIGKMMTLRGLLGPQRHNITVTNLINIGRVAKPNLYLVDVPSWKYRFDNIPHRAILDSKCWVLVNGDWKNGIYLGTAQDEKDGSEYPRVKLGWHKVSLDGLEMEVESRWCLLERAYDKGIIRFNERNNLVIEWAKHFSSLGYPTLVIATRTPHVYILQAMMEKHGLTPRVLTGLDSTKKRDDTFKWLTSSKGGILISPIVKEGVSLPELKAGIIADGLASIDLARQLIGRFIRKKPTGDNSAHIVFFLDKQIRTLRKAGLDLFSELETIRGYKFCYPCGGPDNLGKWYEGVSVN